MHPPPTGNRTAAQDGRRCALAALLLLAAPAGCSDESCDSAAPELATLRLTQTGGRLLDALEREVLLRGVNAGGRSKFQPFFPFAFRESGLPGQAQAPSFEAAAAAYVERIAGWGVNLVRLPFTWEAVEPVRGSIDETFLGRYQRVAELLGQHQIRVIVDAHQDVFARPYCGDGFPPWACPQPAPEPPADCSDWFLAYLSGDAAVAAAFDRFWANEDGLRDAFRAMWRRVAQQLWQVDAVVGFEILNEPYRGSASDHQFETQVLPAFYEELAADIRSVAPGALVLFDASGLSANTTVTQLRRPQGEDLVFAPHYYSASAFLGVPHNAEEIHDSLGRWAQKREAWSLPVLVGEFGIRPAAKDAPEYVRLNHDALDAQLLHGTQWEVSTTADDWNDEGMSLVDKSGADTALVAELVRAYPLAVAGSITSYSYDAALRQGVLVYQARAGGVTEIATPERLYGAGLEARLEGVAGCVTATADGRLLARSSAAGSATLSFGPR